MKNIMKRTRSRHSGGSSGFSLVEVVIALAVFAVLALVVSMIVAATSRENWNNVKRNKQADVRDYAYHLGVAGNTDYSVPDGATGVFQGKFAANTYGVAANTAVFSDKNKFVMNVAYTGNGASRTLMKGHMPFFDIRNEDYMPLSEGGGDGGGGGGGGSADDIVVTFADGWSVVGTAVADEDGKVDEADKPTISGVSGWSRFSDNTGSLWDFDNDTTDKSIWLYAVRGAVSSFTVRFDLNGDNTDPPSFSSQTILTGPAALPQPEPTRTGYNFAGWWTGPESDPLATVWDFGTAVTGDMTLYARWNDSDVAVYTVTFDFNYPGSVPVTTPVNEGANVAEPTGFARPGYTFDGWYKNLSDPSPYPFAIPVTESFTLHAKWNGDESEVTYNAAGGTPTPAPVMVRNGTTIDAPPSPAPTRENYHFLGWYTDGDVLWVFGTGGTLVTEAITLTAKWTTAETFTVTYHPNGSDVQGMPVPSTFTVANGDPLSRPDDPTRPGGANNVPPAYTFGGWYKDVALTDDWDFVSDTVTVNTDLYAKWTAVQTHLVEFYSKGVIAYTQNVVNGQKATRPSNPVNGGAADTFVDWVTTETGNTPYDFENTPVTAPTKIYAKWNTEYTVTFMSNKEYFGRQTVISDTKATTPTPDPVNGIAKFKGWFKSADGAGNGTGDEWVFLTDTVKDNITLYAKWVPCYTLKFDANTKGIGGVNSVTGVPENQIVESGTTATAPASNPIWSIPLTNGGVAQSVRSATFSGKWYEDEEFTKEWKFGDGGNTVTKNTTLYAKWNPVVAFNLDGGTYTATDSVYANRNNNDITDITRTYGATLPEFASKPQAASGTSVGKVFLGWYKVPFAEQENGNAWPRTTGTLWKFGAGGDKVTEPMCLVAKWGEQPPKVTKFAFVIAGVEYEGVIEQDNHTITVTVPHGTDTSNITPVVVYDSPTYADYVPTNWSYSPVEFRVRIGAGDNIVKYDVTVTVAPAPAPTTHTVTYVTNYAGANSVTLGNAQTINVTDGTKVTGLPIPSKTDAESATPPGNNVFDFAGWYRVPGNDVTAETSWVFDNAHKFDVNNTNVTSKLLLVAGWTSTVTFNANGGTGTLPADQTVLWRYQNDLGGSVVRPATPTPPEAGKVLDGWYFRRTAGAGNLEVEYDFNKTLAQNLAVSATVNSGRAKLTLTAKWVDAPALSEGVYAPHNDEISWGTNTFDKGWPYTPTGSTYSVKYVHNEGWIFEGTVPTGDIHYFESVGTNKWKVRSVNSNSHNYIYNVSYKGIPLACNGGYWQTYSPGGKPLPGEPSAFSNSKDGSATYVLNPSIIASARFTGNVAGNDPYEEYTW